MKLRGVFASVCTMVDDKASHLRIAVMTKAAPKTGGQNLKKVGCRREDIVILSEVKLSVRDSSRFG